LNSFEGLGSHSLPIPLPQVTDNTYQSSIQNNPGSQRLWIETWIIKRGGENISYTPFKKLNKN
jgi:hypothetical protein